MLRTLFLDMDGVLNKRATFFTRGFDPLDPLLIQNLNVVTSFFCPLDICVSSTWRKVYPCEALIEKLQMAGLCNFLIVGYTPSLNSGKRGHEIRDWLLENPWRNAGKWCIVDDDSDMLPSQQDRFVHTSFDEGLTRSKADDIISLLR